MLGDVTTQNFLLQSQSLKIQPQVLAEWNHNTFSNKRIYGSFSADLTVTSPIISFTSSFSTSASSHRTDGYYYSSLEKDIIATFSNTDFSKMGEFPATNAYAYRITFFTKISSSGAYSNTLDSKLFLNFIQYNGATSLNMSESIAFNANDRGWQQHEVLIWPDASTTTKFVVDARTDIANTRILISNFTITQVKKHEGDVKGIFNVKDVFSSFRPGDQLAEKTFAGSTLNKQLSKNIYNYPVGNGNLSNVCYPSSDGKLLAPSINKFTYFVDKSSDASASAGVYCIYDKALFTNKIMIKMLNGGGTSTLYSNVIINYELYTFDGSVWTKYSNPATLSNDGSLVLYWSGSTWNQTENQATLTDDGRTLLNTTTIYGIGIRVTSIGIVDDSGTQRALSTLTGTTTITYKGKVIQLGSVPIDKTIRFLELSPRLSVDISDYIIEYNVTKDMDSDNYPLPIGLATANAIAMTLDNVKRVNPNNNKVYTIFNDESGISALSKMCKKDVKITAKYDIYDTQNTKKNPSKISMITAYTDTWSGGGGETTSVSCRDYAKILMQQKSTDVLFMMDNPRSNISNNQNQFAKIGYLIEHFLELNGFSDFYIDKNIADYYIGYFYTENNQNVWETLQGLMLAYQLSASIDEEGILRFFNYLQLKSTSTTPLINFSDSASGLNLPNIIDLSTQDKISPSEIKAKYRVLAPKVSTNIKDGDIENIEFVSTRAPELLWSPQEATGLGYATLKEDLAATDVSIKLDTTNWNTGILIWPEYSGYAVLEQEIIKYDGVLHSYIQYGSVTAVSKAGDLVTASVSDHNFSVGDKVNLSKAGPPLNCDGGSYTVTAVPDINSVTFDVSTGTISPLASGLTTPTNLSATLLSGDLISTKYYTVKSAEDLQQLTYNVSSKESNSYTDYTFGIRNLGILMNIERGKFGTKAMNHLLYAPSTGSTANQQLEASVPDARFAKFSGSAATQYLPTATSFGPVVDPAGTDRMRYINLVSDTTVDKTAIMVNNVDSDSYNEYRFHFKLNKDGNASSDDFVGVFLGYNPSTGAGIFLNLKPETNSSTSIMTNISFTPNGPAAATSTFMLDTMDEIKTIKKKDGKIVYYRGRPVYEVTGHVWNKFQEILVRIYTNKIVVTANGKRLYWTVPGITGTQGDVSIASSVGSRSNRSIGFYVSNHTIAWFKDMSAGGDENFLVARDLKFTKNLNPILFDGRYALQKPFKFDTCPTLQGMRIIDTTFDKSPAFGMKVFAPVGGYENVSSTSKTQTTLYKVTEGHSAISNILYNSNRAKFLIINSGGQILPLKSTTDNFAPLMLSGEIIVQSQDAEVIQKIDDSYGIDSIEFNSQWFQSESQVKQLLKTIAQNVPEGMVKYTVQIFGNPLIQVGDTCNLYFSQNNINNDTDLYIVVGVNHSYDGGISTTVTLRKIRW